MRSLFKAIIVSVLTYEAKVLLKRTKPKIIAITGSVGKTSIKDAAYTVLKDTHKVRKSEKSYNSEIGVPLSVLGLQNAWNNPFLWLKNIFEGALLTIHPVDYPKILILEIGIDRPGDMAKLTQWIHPDVVVLSRLPDIPVHVEFFESPEDVIDEKVELVHALKQDGAFVYNHDDNRVQEIADGMLQQTIGYSRYSLSPYTASADKIVYRSGKPAGIEFTLTHLDTSVQMGVIGSLGVQHAYNYAAAAAVGSVFGVTLDEAAEKLEYHLPPPGRMKIISGLKDTIIIDDTYNSSPVASERSLQTLKELTGVGRRIAVLGDMMELGQYSVREHERIGELAAEVADILITVGIRAHSYAKAALEKGISEKHILQYDDVLRAGRELQELIKPGDVILIKGSQSIRAEKIVEEVMASPEEAEKLLVRQSKEWKRK